MAVDLDPGILRTPALNLINEALVRTANTQDGRLIISMPPQQGKSWTAVRRFATWLLSEDPDRKIVVASYEHNVARRWGRQIRDDVVEHSEELGLKVRADISAQNEWELQNGVGGVFTTGIGGGLTGRKSDVMIIDDPVKDAAQANSKVQRETIWEWWDQTAQTRLAPGAPVIVIMTRWHQDDLAGRLISEHGEDWEVLNIPAQAEHRPEKGETDILGRQPGEFLESVQAKAKANLDNDAWWASRKRGTSPKTWAAMYQGHPSPDEGGVFPQTDDWGYYDEPLWNEHRDGTFRVPGVGRDDTELVMSWDLAFKETTSSDYVVGQVWLRIGVKAYLLDQVRGRMDFNKTVKAIKRLAAKWPEALAKFIEDKANGPAVINFLTRELNGLIPIEPEGSKYARANAISPYIHAKDVMVPRPTNTIFPKELRDEVNNLISEAADFPNSANDDAVDAMSQAINRLLSMPIEEDQNALYPDDQLEIESRGYLYSAF